MKRTFGGFCKVFVKFTQFEFTMKKDTSSSIRRIPTEWRRAMNAKVSITGDGHHNVSKYLDWCHSAKLCLKCDTENPQVRR